jgi:hypothetical protein
MTEVRLQAGGTQARKSELPIETAERLGVRERLRELAGERRRFGARRLSWLLAERGQVINWKKL